MNPVSEWGDRVKKILSVFFVCLIMAAVFVSVPAGAEGLMPSLSRELVNLYPSQSFRLTVTDTTHSYTLSSADQNIARVDDEGILYAVSVGITEVKCVFSTGEESVCTVNVKEGNSPEKVTLDNYSLTLVKGESKTLKAAVYPAQENAYKSFTSSDEEIAKVDQEGNIEALRPGAAVITVESESSAVAASCIVRVIPSVGGNPFGSDLGGVIYNVAGERLSGAKAALKSNTHSAHAAADAQGRFRFANVSTGNYVLTVYPDGTQDNPISANVCVNSTDIKLSCIVSEKNLTVLYGSSLSSGIAASDIVIPVPSLTLGSGEQYDLPYNIYPAEAKDTALIFSVSDPAVVNIDDKGRISAAGEGTAFVYVSTADGRIMKKCTVHVKEGGIGSLGWAIIFLQLLIIVLMVAMYLKKQEVKKRTEEI